MIFNLIYTNNLSQAEKMLNSPTFNPNITHPYTKCPLISCLIIMIHENYIYGLEIDNIVKLLKVMLSHPNIDVNMTDINLDTPLMLAVRYKMNWLIRELVKHKGLDFDAKNDTKQTARGIAIENNFLEQYNWLLHNEC